MTELQPRDFQPPTCIPSSSQGEYPHNDNWFAELNELQGQNVINQQEGEDNIFCDGEEEIDGDSEMHGEIQQCLSLNRDYQVIIYSNMSLTGPLAQFLQKLYYFDRIFFLLWIIISGKAREVLTYEQKKET